jgi:hypothetical protein
MHAEFVEECPKAWKDVKILSQCTSGKQTVWMECGYRWLGLCLLAGCTVNCVQPTHHGSTSRVHNSRTAPYFPHWSVNTRSQWKTQNKAHDHTTQYDNMSQLFCTNNTHFFGEQYMMLPWIGRFCNTFVLQNCPIHRSTLYFAEWKSGYSWLNQFNSWPKLNDMSSSIHAALWNA